MKVIFLDIDGVMVTGSYLLKSTAYEGYQFNPSCVNNLKEIIAKTGSKIVVSSSWRKRGIYFLKKIFQLYGIYGLVGQTPVIDHAMRGDEIKQYIQDSILNPIYAVEKFIILDDNDDMGDLLPYLVQTNWYIGIDEKVKERAIRMLR